MRVNHHDNWGKNIPNSGALSYDNNKITFNTTDTSNCENGCELYIGIYKEDKKEENEEDNKIKEDKDEIEEIKEDLLKNSINRYKIHKIKFKYRPKWLNKITKNS